MKIRTRDFGEVEIVSEEVITFRQPIYGFEQLSRYVLLSDELTEGQFMWLQSTEDERICFIVADPQLLVKKYHPSVTEEIKRLIELNAESEMTCRVIVVIPEEFKKATVNLKSPIIINNRNKCAAQIILEEDYPIREYLLSAEMRGE